ncbi:hypothetical protein G4378_14235 [Dorea longicatena]|nr:hypothetical protein [Dorea longicatena]NSC55265.1 hypothetical protein [Dorea longicatena]NSD09620.1 hypothetical protein [Dorea longicatena]NSF13030.1 hypothetical protein [Dorea longicatena]
MNILVWQSRPSGVVWTVPDYKKFTETFFKAEIISEYRYLVKDVDMETG